VRVRAYIITYSLYTQHKLSELWVRVTRAYKLGGVNPKLGLITRMTCACRECCALVGVVLGAYM